MIKVQSRKITGLPALIEELASHELDVNACAVLRLLGLIAAPLLVALLVDSVWVTVLSWIVLGILYYPLLRDWGYTYLALMLGILPAYIYFELSGPPNWLAFAAVFMGFASAVYIVERHRTIRALKRDMTNRAEASGSNDVHSGHCPRAGAKR
jgi:4-hydroxybenzoate polyprenyltransferase